MSAWSSLRGPLVAACIVAACAPACVAEGEETSEQTEQGETTRDLLEGAYVKQGGTPVYFVFRKGDEPGDPHTFFGELGDSLRASGRFEVGRDDLGAVLKLTLDEGDPERAGNADGSVDGAAGEPAPILKQAFSGKMYYLKIGRNETILIRADASGKTAHYRKRRTWCGKRGARDCAASVQRTGLSCQDDLVCTKAHECTCER